MKSAKHAIFMFLLMGIVILLQQSLFIVQQTQHICFFRTKTGIEGDFFRTVGSGAAVIAPWPGVTPFRFRQQLFRFRAARIPAFAGIGDPDKIMLLIFGHNASAVFEHDPQGRGIIPENPQINLFLRNDAVSFLQRQAQAFCSVAFSAERLRNELADMTGAGPQGFTQAMADPELADDGIVIPEKEECFRHVAFRKPFAFGKGKHFRKGRFLKNLPGNIVPGVG